MGYDCGPKFLCPDCVSKCTAVCPIIVNLTKMEFLNDATNTVVITVDVIIIFSLLSYRVNLSMNTSVN